MRHFLRRCLRRSILSGTCAALSSAVALSLGGLRDERSAVGPLNGPSQWLWGEREARTTRASLRHTAVGYAIHHASSLMWAFIYEMLSDRQRRTQSPMEILAKASGVTALAFAVDYELTPRRLQPGFEKHLRPASTAAVYAAFALGLAAVALAGRKEQRNTHRVVPPDCTRFRCCRNFVPGLELT